MEPPALRHVSQVERALKKMTKSRLTLESPRFLVQPEQVRMLRNPPQGWIQVQELWQAPVLHTQVADQHFATQPLVLEQARVCLEYARHAFFFALAVPVLAQNVPTPWLHLLA